MVLFPRLDYVAVMCDTIRYYVRLGWWGNFLIRIYLSSERGEWLSFVVFFRGWAGISLYHWGGEDFFILENIIILYLMSLSQSICCTVKGWGGSLLCFVD